MSAPPPPSLRLPGIRVGRRQAIGLLAGTLPVPAWAAAPPADPLAQGATMLVAGPLSGDTDRWAEWLAPLIAPRLGAGTTLRREAVGGADGVTAANQFDARVSPDGTTAMLIPGDAALAWLVGDPRAQFDAAHWVPIFAGIGSGVVIGRIPAAGLVGQTPLRIGAATPGGADLPALLGLELAGIQFAPVFGLTSEMAAENALAQGAVDLVFLHGQLVPARMTALRRSGAVPLFALGTISETGQVVRDPLLPEVPTLPETCVRLHGVAPGGPLWEAWRASSAAVQLDVSLVLPQLTPAALVALWRRACREAAGSPELQAAVAPLELRALASPLATASGAAVATNATALLELRRWLATRFNWRPR